MHLFSIFTVALITALPLMVGGCGTTRKARPSVAVVITSVGVDTVSAAEVTQIHQALRPEIEGAGYTFADSNITADLVLTVSFIRAPGSSVGRIKLASLEPAAEFRRAAEGGESAESKQWRRLERELQATVEALGRNLDSR